MQASYYWSEPEDDGTWRLSLVIIYPLEILVPSSWTMNVPGIGGVLDLLACTHSATQVHRLAKEGDDLFGLQGSRVLWRKEMN